MIEPIGIRIFPDYRGEKYQARQMIFKARNGLGLSVINVGDPEASRFGNEHDIGHGWYVSGPDQYEVLLIDAARSTVESPFKFDWVDAVDAMGWLRIEDLGNLLEAIEERGQDGYLEWRSARW